MKNLNFHLGRHIFLISQVVPIKGGRKWEMSSFWNVGSLLGYPTQLQALVPQSPSFPLPWPHRPYTDFFFFSPISPALGALSNFKPKSPSLQVVSCILGCFFTNWATLETELVKSEDKQEKKKKKEREIDTTFLHSISKKEWAKFKANAQPSRCSGPVWSHATERAALARPGKTQSSWCSRWTSPRPWLIGRKSDWASLLAQW